MLICSWQAVNIIQNGLNTRQALLHIVKYFNIHDNDGSGAAVERNTNNTMTVIKFVLWENYIKFLVLEINIEEV